MFPSLWRYVKKMERWIHDDTIGWLGPNELPGDIFIDLSPENGDLSVFLVENEQDVERVTAAWCATRSGGLVPTSFVLFSREVIEASFSLRQSPGDTADDYVNQLHYNIAELTVHGVARLAEVIVPICSPDTIPAQSIETQVQLGIQAGYFDMKQVKSKKVKVKKEV